MTLHAITNTEALVAFTAAFEATAESEFCYREFAQDCDEAILREFRQLDEHELSDKVILTAKARELCLELGEAYDLTPRPHRW